MTYMAFTVPLSAQTQQEIESRHILVKSHKYYQTPIDEAVQAVREAQDAVGIDIWANTKEREE